MKIAVVGSRDYEKLGLVQAIVSRFGKSTEIISGGALGVDTVAEVTAELQDLKVTIFRPDWDKLGRKAGFVRNLDIIRAADLVLAFWDGESHGTANSIRIAYSWKKPIVIFGSDGAITGHNGLASLEGEEVAEVTQHAGVSLLHWLEDIAAHDTLHFFPGETVPYSKRTAL